MSSIFRLSLGAFALIAIAGCASGNNNPTVHDGLVVPRDAGVERNADRGPADFFPLDHAPLPQDLGVDLQKPDQGPPCQLGTPSDCKNCGDVCPGSDSLSTVRVCRSGGVCDIECLEEFYDVNGDVLDGCEIEDDKPVHDVESAAKNMGSVEDCDNKQSTTAIMPSDARRHQKAPTDRPQGRGDWFKLHIADKSFCVVDASATVSLAGLSSAASYRVTGHYTCDNGSKMTPVTKTINGGSSTTVAPSTSCTTLGDDSGTILIEVVKLSGPHSKASYTVSIEP